MRAPAVLLACLFLLAPGCKSPDRQLMESLSESWQLLRPYCLAGIAADAALDQYERALRDRQVEEFTLTLRAGLEAAEGGLQAPGATPTAPSATQINIPDASSAASPPSAGPSPPSLSAPKPAPAAPVAAPACGKGVRHE